MTKKFTSIVAALALVLSIVGVNTASALTAGDIAMLQAAGIISASQAATLSAGLTPTSSVSTGGYSFTRDLTIGSKGADVTALQEALVNAGHLSMPAGVAYGYFGSVTKSALVKYQLSKGITPAAGYFGPKTRTSFGSMTTGGTTGPVVSGTDLMVGLSATSPLASALIAGQAAANLAEFTFTNKSAAPAVVTNVTLQRLGVSADTSLTNVYLYNGATRLTDAASVSAGKITFNAASGIFTVPAGSSLTISVRADIASDANGQLVAVALTGVTASLPVSAVYPVSGSSMSVFSSTDIAKATSTLLGSVTGATSITAGSLNQTVWGTSLNLSGRAVYLRSLALKVIGSVPTNSLQNVKLYVSGIQVAQSMGMDANGMLTFDLSSAPYKIDSSRNIEVRADVVNGSSRTFNVQLQNASDLMLIDSNYNVGIAVALSGTQSTGLFTVSTGSVTVTLDSSLASGNIVTGASNVELARYTLKAFGEDMKISYLQASSTDQLDNVSLYANGVQIGSTKTISATGTAAATLYSLGSSLIIPAGQTVTLSIKGDIKYNGTNATTTSNTIKVALSGYASNAQGSYSSQLSTVPSTLIEGPVMTVVGAGLTVAQKSGLSTITVPNKTGVKIGSYVLQANSSEAIRITNLTAVLTGTVSATTSLSNIYVSVDGVMTTPVNAQSSNNFSVNFTIPSNSSKTVDVYADVSNTSGTIITSLTVNGYGVGSNITVSPSAVTGQTVSVGAGTLATPTLDDNSSAASQLVVGNTSGLLANYSFTSANGDSTITKMEFTATGSIVAITVGGVTREVVAGATTSISGLNLVVPAGFNATKIPVSVTYGVIGYGQGSSTLPAYITLTGYEYTSGNNTVATTTVAVNSKTMVVVASKPTVTVSSPVQYNGVRTGNVSIARITITPDAAGPVGIVSLPIKIQTSANSSTTAVTSVVKVNGPSGQVVPTTGSVAAVAANGSATGTITFTGNSDGKGYILSGATTFDIIGDVFLALDGSISTSIASSTSGFVWADINGGATTTGAYILNFPTNAAAVNYNN